MIAGGSIIIACQTVVNELRSVLPARSVVCQSIDPGLHTRPQKLKETLQQAIDNVDGHYDPIILGFGLCAQAVVGLKALTSTLIIPRVDDCIALFLGSGEVYKNHLKDEPGTYFLSPGWIEAGTTLVDELKTLVERFGKHRADRIQKEMLKNYKRLVFITMESQDIDRHKQFSRQAASELGLKYEELLGSPQILNLMATGPWEEGLFVVVPPGNVVNLEAFLGWKEQPPRV